MQYLDDLIVRLDKSVLVTSYVTIPSNVIYAVRTISTLNLINLSIVYING